MRIEIEWITIAFLAFSALYALARTVEYLVLKSFNKKDRDLSEYKPSLPVFVEGSVFPCRVKLVEDELNMLTSLYELHMKTDENGVPLMYVPRSLSASLEEITKNLADISSQQEKITYILERIITKMVSIHE